MTATSLVSFQAGWWPPARSMMLSRRIPSASPGARASPARNPSSSGPRCSIAAVIARRRDSACALREAKATPHMPHTLLFDLRRGEEGGAGSHGVRPQTEARDSQTAVCIPGKRSPKQLGGQQLIAAPPVHAKNSMSARLQENHSTRLDSARRACCEASVADNASMSRTGSSHPRRDVEALYATLASPEPQRAETKQGRGEARA